MKGLAKEHICITHRHRQQCGDGQREGGTEWRRAKGVKMGASVTVSIMKIKKKKLLRRK